MKRYFKIVKMLLLSIVCPGLGSCTTIVAGKKASAYGSVLLGHNEDNRGELSTLYKAPRISHEKKETVLMNGGGELPQVPTTWSYLWSEVPGQTFCDFYLNEWGVAITSNSATSKEQDMEALKREGFINYGGIDYWLRRIVAERARSAREGLELAVSLIAFFGYNDCGRMYEICDRNEVWILHVTAGRNYCARRLPDDEVAVIPNSYIIGRVCFDDKNCLTSPGLVEYARKRGWYREDSENDNFEFNRVFGEKSEGYVAKSDFYMRQWAGQTYLTGCEVQSGPLPFSVKPEKPVTVEKIKQILRSHYENTSFAAIAGTNECPHYANERSICYSDTKESIIVQYAKQLPTSLGTVMWRAAGHPCSSVYIPFYLGIRKVPEGYCMMGYEEAIKTHFCRNKSLLRDHRTPWWSFSHLQGLVDRNYKRYSTVITEGIEKFETGLKERLREFEKNLYAAGDKAAYKDIRMYSKAAEKLEEFTCTAANEAWKWAVKAGAALQCRTDVSES